MKWFGHTSICRMTKENLSRRGYETRAQDKTARAKPRRVWKEDVKVEAERRRKK